MNKGDDMGEDEKSNLGLVKIHNHVIAQIIANAVKDVKGVRLVNAEFPSNLLIFFGLKIYPGISITEDKNGQVSIDMSVIVEYGNNVPDVARFTQQAVRSAIEKTVDADLKVVNVCIQGIERRKP